jgi:hypothetical protein
VDSLVGHEPDEVNDIEKAHNGTVTIHHRQLTESPRLEDGDRISQPRASRYGGGMSRHDVANRGIEQVVVSPFEEASEVAVGEDALERVTVAHHHHGTGATGRKRP